jgi:hypothetical protein
VSSFTQGLHFNIVCYPFCYLSIPIGIGSSVSILSSLDAFAGSVPFETFLTLNYCLTLVYNLITFHLWNARARLFPCRFQIVHLMNHAPKHRRGESEWISLLLMDSSTFLSTSRSECFGDLHTSISAHHDVYTDGNLLRIMQHFQARTSTYDFHLIGILFGATFFI